MLKMRSTFVLFIFSFVLVNCRSESDCQRQLGETNGPGDSPSDFDRLMVSEEPRGHNIGDHFHDLLESFYEREIGRLLFSLLSKDKVTSSRPVRSNQFPNNRDSETGENRPHGESGSGQFQSRPTNQGSTNFRPIQEGNNFSGRPQGSGFGGSSGSRPGNESSTFGGFRPGNEGHSSGRPNEGLNSGGLRPGNEGHSSGRPNEGLTSGGFRPGNEGHSSGRPNEGSTSGGLRPGNEGHSSGRPSEGLTSGGFRPGNEGHSSGRPNEGSTSGGLRPGNEGHSSGRPSEGLTSGGLRPGNEGHSSKRPNEGSTSGGFRPGNEGHSSGRPSEGSTSGGFRPGNEGHSSKRPNEGSTSGGFRPGNEGHSSGRPSEGLTSGGLRPGNEGHSERPTHGSSFGGSSGFRPTNEGSTFGRPSQGSIFGSSSGSDNSFSSGRPNEGLSSGQSSGFRPGNENHSKRPTQESGFGSLFRPGSEDSSSSGTPHEGSTFGQLSGFRPQGIENHEEDIQGQKEDDDDVCYIHLGCFKMQKPWKSTFRPISAPEPPEKIQTALYFYSRQNPNEPEEITVYPTIKMNKAKFDSEKISVIIVHGFANSGNATWMKEMKDVYLKKVDANVMLTDWGKGAQLGSYLQVAGNTRVVGKELALFVKYLIEEHDADPGRFHLIGHSLGAQICSYLAKDVPGIARLTALDPAQPGFEGFSKEVRLDKSDAEFVDVLHTDATPFIPMLGFGMITPHGHVDFYMNGGFDQPGCIPPSRKDLPSIRSFLDLAKLPVEVIAAIVACPHSRAYQYLIEAFNETDSCIFWGHKMDIMSVFKTVTNTLTQGLFKKFVALSTTCSRHDCIPLGFATKKSPLRGAFVVTTNSYAPFCISEDGVPPETLTREKKSIWEKFTFGLL